MFLKSFILRFSQMTFAVLGIFCLLMAASFHLKQELDIVAGYLLVAAGLGVATLIVCLSLRRMEDELTVEVARILYPAGILVSVVGAAYFSFRISETMPNIGREREIFGLCAALMSVFFVVRMFDLPWLRRLDELPKVRRKQKGAARVEASTPSETEIREPFEQAPALSLASWSPLRILPPVQEKLTPGTFLQNAEFEITMSSEDGKSGTSYYAILRPTTIIEKEWPAQLAALQFGVKSVLDRLSPVALGNDRVRAEVLMASLFAFNQKLADMPESLEDSSYEDALEQIRSLRGNVISMANSLSSCGFRSQLGGLGEFIEWSRYHADGEMVHTPIVHEFFGSHGYCLATRYESVLQEAPVAAVRIPLDCSGFWKIVVFNVLKGQWRGVSMGFSVVKPVRVGRGEATKEKTLLRCG